MLKVAVFPEEILKTGLKLKELFLKNMGLFYQKNLKKKQKRKKLREYAKEVPLPKEEVKKKEKNNERSFIL
jgi:hypothetical protein